MYFDVVIHFSFVQRMDVVMVVYFMLLFIGDTTVWSTDCSACLAVFVSAHLLTQNNDTRITSALY